MVGITVDRISGEFCPFLFFAYFYSSGRKTAFMLVLGTVIATACVIPTMIVGCDQVPITGLQLNNQTDEFTVNPYSCSECTSPCLANEIQLVQDNDGILYSSPCAAGCITESDHSKFGNCSCLASDQNSVTSKITPCSKSKMWIILFLWGVMSLSHGIIGGPYISLFLESLSGLSDKNVKVVAFGVMHLMTKIIGYAPGNGIRKYCI